MSALRWLSGLLLALAVVAGGALLWQRQATAQLRGEIALLRNEHRQLERLRAENQRLVAAQVSDTELAQLRADRAALARLGGELASVKAQTDKMTRAAEFAPETMVAAGEWKNAGRVTPAAAVETLLWAASRHDVDALASMLIFDAELRPAVDRFFADLPEALQTQHGTVERLVVARSLTSDLPLAAMQIVAETRPNADHAELVVRLQGQDGHTKEIPLSMQRRDDGWRLVVPPKALQKIANEIGAQMPAVR